MVTRFPALKAGYMFLLGIVIGSLDFLRLLWLAKVVALVLVLRHTIGNTSSIMQSLRTLLAETDFDS